ncbi:tetratricopeptide repeat protein [Streptomyces sp. NPDC002845]
MGARVERELERLAVEGAQVLMDGVCSAEWRGVRDGFVEWFSRNGQGAFAEDLRRLAGRTERHEDGDMVERRWRAYVRSTLVQAVGTERATDELRALIAEFTLAAKPDPDAAPESCTTNTVSGSTVTGSVIQAANIGSVTTNSHAAPPPSDHFDFRGSTFNGPVTGAQYNHPYGTVSLPDPANWPTTASADPIGLGVHRTRRFGGEPLLPPYVARDVEERLVDLLVESQISGGLIVVTGEPLSGKTRTAWEAVARTLPPQTRVYAPSPGMDLRRLPDALRDREGVYVVWLDELEGHLSEQGLDSGLLTQLSDLKVTVMATMNDEVYDAHRFGGGRASRLLGRAETVGLTRDWSEDELGRLLGQHAEGSALLTDAVNWRGDHSVTEYLAVGPELRDLWSRAARPGSPHPQGHLLVRAAIDFARCGVTRNVPSAMLEDACGRYGIDAFAAAGRESAEEAFTWAAEQRRGVTGLLVRGGGREFWRKCETETWRAYGSLVADVMRDDSWPPVPDEFWHFVVEETRDDSEVIRSVWRAAHPVFAPRAEDGDPEALRMMGLLSEAVYGEEAALVWFRRAVEAGRDELAGRLGKTLFERGEVKDALPYLQIAAEKYSDRDCARLLGQAHRALAEQWLRTAADRGDGNAAHQLGDMLFGSGDTTESLQWYAEANEAGHEAVTTSIGRLLLFRQNVEAAEAWLRRGAARGDPQALYDLAFFLDRLGGHDTEVEHIYRRAMAAGYPAAPANLGKFLSRTGAVQEGEELLRQAADQGSGEAAYWLWKLLKERGGEPVEADEWLRRAAEQGHYYAKKLLGRLPTPPSDPPATVKE